MVIREASQDQSALGGGERQAERDQHVREGTGAEGENHSARTLAPQSQGPESRCRGGGCVWTPEPWENSPSAEGSWPKG